jgi:hypothetical protein
VEQQATLRRAAGLVGGELHGHGEGMGEANGPDQHIGTGSYVANREFSPTFSRAYRKALSIGLEQREANACGGTELACCAGLSEHGLSFERIDDERLGCRARRDESDGAAVGRRLGVCRLMRDDADAKRDPWPDSLAPPARGVLDFCVGVTRIHVFGLGFFGNSSFTANHVTCVS